LENLGEVAGTFMTAAPVDIREQYRRLQVRAPFLDGVAITMLQEADARGTPE
jgi:hypothetical protein